MESFLFSTTKVGKDDAFCGRGYAHCVLGLPWDNTIQLPLRGRTQNFTCSQSLLQTLQEKVKCNRPGMLFSKVRLLLGNSSAHVAAWLHRSPTTLPH